jgi:hypothetical protein
MNEGIKLGGHVASVGKNRKHTGMSELSWKTEMEMRG